MPEWMPASGWALFAPMATFVLVVLGIDLGLAFLVRGSHESVNERD